jgi:hypothetical protein
VLQVAVCPLVSVEWRLCYVGGECGSGRRVDVEVMGFSID